MTHRKTNQGIKKLLAAFILGFGWMIGLGFSTVHFQQAENQFAALAAGLASLLGPLLLICFMYTVGRRCKCEQCGEIIRYAGERSENGTEIYTCHSCKIVWDTGITLSR